MKISIYNNKGGVAKTTSVINIAYAMNKAEKKVLVVDCDTQMNCFEFFLSGNPQNIVPVDDKNKDIFNRILSTDYENIFNTTYGAYTKLSSQEIKEYDYVIFDLPPVLSDEVLNIIKNSDKVYVPLILGAFEISGLKNLTSKCGNKLGGIFVTMYKNRDRALLKQIRATLKNRLMDTVIPYSETVIDSQREKLPLEDYFIMRRVPFHLQGAWKVVNAYTQLTYEIMGGKK